MRCGGMGADIDGQANGDEKVSNGYQARHLPNALCDSTRKTMLDAVKCSA